MKTKRKAAPRPMDAQVISLAAYRDAHPRPVVETFPQKVGAGGMSLMDAYCRWLALAGAMWAFWW
jgi:hypothetical protein